MKTIEVVAAIIRNKNKILCVQRPWNKFEYISYKFEFPGGKIEFDEDEKDALIREILEELSLEITIDSKLMIVEHDYPDFHLKMHAYLSSCKNIEIVLNEHISYVWLDIKNMQSLEWVEADLQILNQLINL